MGGINGVVLIPQECHKPAFGVCVPGEQTTWQPLQKVIATQISFGTKGHDEKGHKQRKRHHRGVENDDVEISEEAFDDETSSPAFRSLLDGFTLAYA